MSVLIKGMDMPKKGLLEVIISPDGIAYALDRPLIDTENASVSRFHDAVELPNHGDLIDRDELMKHGVYMPREGGNLPLVYMSYVKAAKTVIPAERNDDGKA